MKNLSFIFKKNPDKSVSLFGFKVDKHGDPVLISEEKKDLSHHELLMNIEEVNEEVFSDSWLTQKTIKVQLPQDIYKKYVEGEFSNHAIKENPSLLNASSSATPSAPPADLATVFSQLMLQQQQSNAMMMDQFMKSISLLIEKKETKKMIITRFDGQNEDANTWMVLYERSCDANGWESDEMKINNLKACLVPASSADRWFSSRIIDQGNESWDEWKDDFLSAFTQNKIQAAQRAIRYEYRGGSLMDFYYEKERLLKLAFPDLGQNSFITHVMLGLPSQLQGQLMSMDPKKRSDLISCLQKLPQQERLKRNQAHDQTSKSSETNRNNNSNKDKSHDQKKNVNFKSNDSSKKTSKVNAVYVQDDSEQEDETPVNVVNHVLLDNGKKLPVYKVKCNGLVVNALLDSGSNINLVSQELIKKNKWKTIPSQIHAEGFDGKARDSSSQVMIKVSFSLIKGGKRREVNINSEAHVFKGMKQELILGYPSLLKSGIELSPLPMETTSVDLIPENQRIISTLNDIEKVFPSVLRTNHTPLFSVPFKLKDGAEIINCKPYRLSRERYQWLQEKLNSLLENNFIRVSTSNYASPVVIVTKENGDLRLCVDYRKINEQTILDPHPFPIIDDVISKFGGCNYFSKFDLKDGFHQASLTEETKQFTAFVTPFSHFEWNRLPFGWKNSPPIFQRLMTQVLGNLLSNPHITVYVDDIICGSETKEGNEALTFKILETLDKNGMTINLQKCQVNVKSVTFLGRTIDGVTRSTREESIEKVRNMSRPRDLHLLRVFMGLTGHFRSFIEKYADIVRPLDSLRKKDVPFEWNEDCEQAFQTLVKIITSNPILSFPDWKLKFEMCTDASNYGSGAILYQRDPTQSRNRQLRVIGYYSYTFTKPEINYCVTEKECLAVIKAVKYFRSYLEGRHFIVHTDHSALTSLMTLHEPKGRLARWQCFLLSYNIEINNRKGTALKDADAISRLCLSSEPITSSEVNVVISSDDDDMKQLIMRRYHDDPDSGGHDGETRVYYKIKSRFQWKGMKADIDNYIKSCHDCQVIKFKYRKKLKYQTLVNHSTTPYECVHLDYGEIMKKSETGKKTRSFILLVDENTRMVHTKAIGMTSKQLIKWLLSLPFFTSIKRIISDNGTSFTSKEYNKFAQDNAISINYCAPYHPEGNGMAERHVQSIKLFLALYPNFKNGWKSCLEAATNHHNRSYCSSIGCSPLFKSTGKPTIFPADKEFGISDQDLLKHESTLTDEQQSEKRRRVAEKFNSKNQKTIPDIKPGDKVLFQSGLKGKDPVIKGPVTIEQITKREGIPKVIKYQEGKQLKTIALKNCQVYKNRLPFSSTTTTILTCLCFLTTTADAVFNKESALLWTRSTIPVIQEVHHYQNNIVIENFCNIFTELKLTRFKQQYLTTWCLSRMEKDFWQPMREICSEDTSNLTTLSHVNNKTLSRAKRAVDPSTISLIVVVFTVLFSVSTTSLAFSTRNFN